LVLSSLEGTILVSFALLLTSTPASILIFVSKFTYISEDSGCGGLRRGIRAPQQDTKRLVPAV